MLIIGITIAIYAFGIMYKGSDIIKLAIFIIAYIIIGKDVLLSAFKNILRGEVFDENFLMSIATLGAFAIGEYPEAVAVMLFYNVGELFQDMAVNRSRKSIKALMNIKPDYANLKVDNNFEIVKPEAVNIGDIILVKPGEKVPLDGTLLSESTQMDTSNLTGESVPRIVNKGDTVLSGFINKTHAIEMKVEKTFGESTVNKILELVENASAKKAPTEKFITRFSRYYTPAVVFFALALAIIPPFFTGFNFSEWLYRALIFLVVSCPCALVVSIPLGFFGRYRSCF
jgi:ATPase, P-type (transporting), HAD superfamily, subfamily IC